MNNNHLHKETDDIFRSMKRNCEEYFNLKKENEYLNSQNDELLKKNKELQDKINKLETNKFKIKRPKWKEAVISICKDGKQRTSTEIYHLINLMNPKPGTLTDEEWKIKTPDETCSATCTGLFNDGLLFKTNDYPTKYFKLIK